MRLIVTGGLGFIGSALIRELITETDHEVLNVDKETYAATRGGVAQVARSDRYAFERADVADQAHMTKLFDDFGPDGVLHLAAETHVDRSIDDPDGFLHTNVLGTAALLEVSRHYAIDGGRDFRFLHVSTDEVFGSLADDEPPFDETTPYRPRSPYAASKAAADHLVRAWSETYGLPTLITNCSNNYGPFQFPEKLIPLVILKAADDQPLPVYGDGSNVRDWLHVADHARGLRTVFEEGDLGATYLLGGSAERTNLQVVETICDIVDDRLGVGADGSRRRLIQFVDDRPGHDHRYAIDAHLVTDELGWEPSVDFETGLAATVDWYLDNEAWWRPIQQGTYDGSRLGVLD